jgi:hypothetical protein
VPAGGLVKARRFLYGFAGVLALAGTGAVAANFRSAQETQPGAAPAAQTAIPDGPFSNNVVPQPIAFPHDRHAGTSRMPCMYCHYSADRSQDAGIPPVQLCAGCHAPAGAPLFLQQSPEIAKLVTYWTEQRPIPWNRIYKLPDHAHFPHMRHVNAGVQCQECHGPVETMPEVVQWSSLQMGWCVECHRQREVRTDCFVCHY